MTRLKKAFRHGIRFGAGFFGLTLLVYSSDKTPMSSGDLFSSALSIGLFCGGIWFFLALFVLSLLPDKNRKRQESQKRGSSIATSFEFEAPQPQAIPPRKKKKQTPTEFEHEVARLIQMLSGKRTQVVGGAGDGGIDVKVFGEDNRLVGVVQCKLYAPNKALSPSYIRDLNTVRHYHHLNTAYLVTTGKFSQASQKLAQQLGIKLIDGASLEKLRNQANPSSNTNVKAAGYRATRPKTTSVHPHAAFMPPGTFD